MATNSVTDIAGVSVVIAAAAFSPEVAEVVGPYLLIATASVLGASFSLARRPTSSRWGAVGYFAKLVGLALLATVMLSAAIASYYPQLSERSLLAPVAFLIGAVGPDWPNLLRTVSKGIIAAVFKTVDSYRSGGPTK